MSKKPIFVALILNNAQPPPLPKWREEVVGGMWSTLNSPPAMFSAPGQPFFCIIGAVIIHPDLPAVVF